MTNGRNEGEPKQLSTALCDKDGSFLCSCLVLNTCEVRTSYVKAMGKVMLDGRDATC